ncbi:MAG: hypothetical protein ACRCSN_19800 [Dermatophilaceae bacterium]
MSDADQVTYTADELMAHLGSIWDIEHTLTNRPAKSGNTGTRSRIQDGHVPDWIVGGADAALAWTRSEINSEEQHVLRCIHHEGYLPSELASSWSVSVADVLAAHDRGLAKMLAYLNRHANAAKGLA